MGWGCVYLYVVVSVSYHWFDFVFSSCYSILFVREFLKKL